MRGWRAMWSEGDEGGDHDDGFSIIEIVVAVGVIFVAMVAMAHAATIALVDVGHARQRQSATGLANRVIEQVRALPADTVRLGLSATDLATGDDPNITTQQVGGGGGVTRYFYNGEEILAHTPAADADASPPLVPHRVQQRVGPTTYWVAVYTTLLSDGETVRVTADVSWVDTALRRGTSARVQAQSLFSPGVGCGDSLAENPYGAPCAASLTAHAFVEEATVTITENNPAGDFQQATLTLPVSYTRLDVGQVNVVRSGTKTSAAVLTFVLAQPVTAGGDADEVMSSSDPDAGTDPYVTASVGPQGAQTIGSSDAAYQVMITTSNGDSGSATSTVEARGLGGMPCLDDGGFDQTDHLPCGNADSQQATTATAELLLPDGAGSSVSVPIVTVGPAPTKTKTVVDRTVVPSSTTCGLEGCVKATVDRTLGLVRIGGDPFGSGWLAEVDDLADDAAAGAGDGSAPPQANTAGTVSAAGTQVDLAGLGSASTTLSPTRSFVAGNYTVTMDGVFTARGASVEEPACNDACTRTATSGAPLRGNFTLLVTTADGDGDGQPDVVADLTVAIDLGRAHASASYERAPGAL